MTSPGTARRLWALGEPFHALTYFARESRAAGERVGPTGFWKTYFAFRAAPLGPVGAEVVTASFYNFAPGFVAGRVPAVWDAVSPAAALQARLIGVDGAVRRVFGEDWLRSPRPPRRPAWSGARRLRWSPPVAPWRRPTPACRCPTSRTWRCGRA